MAESWNLDGLALNDGTALRIMGDVAMAPPKARTDWVGGADSEFAAPLRDPKHENREIALPLEVLAASKNAALDVVGSIRDKLRKASLTVAGIPLTWTNHNSSRVMIFDVLQGEITELPLDFLFVDGNMPRPTLTLTCKPYGRAASETLTSSAASSTPLTTLEITGVPGDVPALGRLIVTDTATQNRKHVEWGMEARSYNAATSLVLDSDSLVVTGTAGAQSTATGAYDPNASGNNAILATVGPLPVSVCKTGNLSHVGAFRVKARCWYSTGVSTEVYVALGWQATGGEYAANLPAIVMPGGWREIDLGTVTIPAAASGTQQWQGILSAYAGAGSDFTEQLYVDYLLFIPVDEGYGKARGVFTQTPGPVVARDTLTGLGNGVALNARVAQLGGTWATSGTTTDFVGITASPIGAGTAVQRGTSSDASARYAVLGSTNYTDMATQVSVNSRYDNTCVHAVAVRWTDASNNLRLEIYAYQLLLRQILAGAVTTLAAVPWFPASNTTYTLRLTAYASGRLIGQVLSGDGANILTPLEATSSAAATGGGLQTGKPAFFDQYPPSGGGKPGIRYYDSFYVSTPQPEPISLYSGQSLEVRHDDTIREDSTGVYYGRPSSYKGSRFLVPPGTSRVAVKGRRDDTDVGLAGNVIDSTTIQVGHTARFLAVPRV